jgi:hypothetical protein
MKHIGLWMVAVGAFVVGVQVGWLAYPATVAAQSRRPGTQGAATFYLPDTKIGSVAVSIGETRASLVARFKTVYALSQGSNEVLVMTRDSMQPGHGHELLGSLFFIDDKLAGVTRQWEDVDGADALKLWRALYDVVTENVGHDPVSVYLTASGEKDPKSQSESILLTLPNRGQRHRAIEIKRSAGDSFGRYLDHVWIVEDIT